MSDLNREELVAALDKVAADALGYNTKVEDIAAAMGRLADALRPDFSMTGVSNSDVDARHERNDAPPSSDLSPLPAVDPDSSLQNAFVQDWLRAWATKHTVFGTSDWMPAAVARSAELAKTPFKRTPEELVEDASRFEGILEHIQGTYDYVEHETEAHVASLPTNRPTVALTNDDLVRVLAGTTMGVQSLDGTDYNVRLATTDELVKQMRAAAEKYGTSAPREGWAYHAERLTTPIDLEALFGKQ